MILVSKNCYVLQSWTRMSTAVRVNLPGACGTHFFPGHVTTTTSNDDGRVMAISQILYCQYHIWDLYVLGLKTKVFCTKKKTTKMDKELAVPRCSLAENTPNVPKTVGSICLPKPKSLEFRWKKASSGVRSPWTMQTAK